MAQISFNPYLTTNAAGSFNVQSDGYIQGIAMADPSSRNWLQGGVLASTETLPMWGGVGIATTIPGAAGGPAPQLGPLVTRATSLAIAATGLAPTETGTLTGFSVFDSNFAGVSSAQSPVPLVGNVGEVNFFALGSRARIPLAVDPALISAIGSPTNTPVSWDFVNQRLIPYAPAFATVTITGATWANTSGGQTTFTVSTDLTAVLNAGDDITVSGVISTGGTGVGYNGSFVVISVTSTTVVISQVSASSPGTYSSGGAITSGGGPLNVSILNFNIGNSMTVVFNPTSGFATWNRQGSVALVRI